MKKWKEYEIQGNGMVVFKEKIKCLKRDIKVWNKEVFGNVNQRVDEIKNKI